MTNFIFVYLPDYNTYKTGKSKASYTLIKNVIKRNNIKFIDIHNEVFKKEDDPFSNFPFGYYGHYNAEVIKKYQKKFFLRPH